MTLPAESRADCPAGSRRIAVRVDDVHKSYCRGSVCTPVLSGVTLHVEQGACVYLAGPSGSGKTTLLSILGCILSADRGRVSIFDQEITTLDEAGRIRLRRDRIGFVFQRFHLIRGLTALDNVGVPLMLAGLSAKEAARRALPLLEAVGLGDKARSHPAQLSTGQCQRVALARALANDPDVILADEPTAALDKDNGREVMALLRRLMAERAKTVIVVTHDQRIFRFADRVYWLENGRVAETYEGDTSASETTCAGVH